MEQRYWTVAAKNPSPCNSSTSLSPCLCLLHPEQKGEDAGNRMQRLKPKNRWGETSGMHRGLCESPLRQCRKKPVHHGREQGFQCPTGQGEAGPGCPLGCLSPGSTDPAPRRGAAPGEPGSPRLELPPLAARGKDIKPCQIFCSHSQGD